jgi:hypothetical protein
MRAFDPVPLGRRECRAWTAYYQRRWFVLLGNAVGMVRSGFRMSWPRTLLGSLYVLRAIRAWAPYPHNDPVAAERLMCRFYALVVRVHGGPADPAESARLEVAWWRVHRKLQRERPEDDVGPLVDALAALYGYVYSRPAEDVRPAAQLRAEAMRISDAWVAAGRDPASPLLTQEESTLVRGYRALLAAVHRPG